MTQKDKLTAVLKMLRVKQNGFAITMKDQYADLVAEHLSKNDVIQVIRCKNCRYYNRRWGCHKLEINVSPDNYCFMAEPSVADREVMLLDEE